jgi:hypothetical protein
LRKKKLGKGYELNREAQKQQMRLLFCPQRLLRFIKADGGSVESREQKALWDKRGKSKRESIFWREGISRQIRFHKIRNISEGF